MKQDYKLEKLKNGLRAIFVPRAGSPAVSVMVLVAAGSEYETKEINGLSHFLEHMCFKGTSNRPTTGQISQELDGFGAQYNAFTDQEYTGYWAKVQKTKFRDIFDLISDLYLNPLLPAAEIEKERGVIIEEMNMYEDMPNRRVHELFQNLLYGDQPAGWDIIGTKDVVRRVGRDDFVDYRTKRYTPQNTIVVVAGGFDIRLARKMVQKSFGILPARKSPQKPKTLSYSPKEKISIKYKKSDQTHLVLGVPGLNSKDPRRFALEVGMEVLGGGMSSRLFYRIREELGAAYYIRAGASFSADHGSVEIWSGADNKRVHQVVSVIAEEIKKLLNQKVGAKELQKAKDHLTGGLILSLEAADNLAGFYAFQEMVSGNVLSPEEVVKKVQAVTPAQVQAVLTSLFKEPLRLAVIGPWKEKKDFAKILSA